MQLLKGDKDFTTSLEKALDETDYRWREYNGLIVAGTHSPEDVEEKIDKIREARHNNTPFLGICFGFQLMVIEYARNVLGKWRANSTEIDSDTNFPVIVRLNDPEGFTEGARRTGMRNTTDLWGNPTLESFWHNYKVNNEYLSQFTEDWKFTQTYDPKLGESIVDYMFYKPSFGRSIHFGVQFHPEYQSSVKKPHWVLSEFLKVCKMKINAM